MTPQELQSLAKKTLEEMVKPLELQAECQIVPQGDSEEGAFTISLQGRDCGRIIGRKGQTLEALELIFNRIMKRHDEDAPWIPLEIDGYTTGKIGDAPRRGGKDGRRFQLDDETLERLTHMAKDCAKEVKHWKKSRKLGPYLPVERRAIHTALKDDPDVTTNSIPAPEAGERMKYVEILLK